MNNNFTHLPKNNFFADKYQDSAAEDDLAKTICQDQSFANMFFYILYGFSILYLIYDKCQDYRQNKIEQRRKEESELMDNGSRSRDRSSRHTGRFTNHSGDSRTESVTSYSSNSFTSASQSGLRGPQKSRDKSSSDQSNARLNPAEMEHAKQEDMLFNSPGNKRAPKNKIGGMKE